jgi:hypothetical protein
MTVCRAQIGFAADSALPRDVMQINPHYETTDPQALANSLKAKMIANPQVGNVMPFTIKVYDAQAPKPSYPIAEAANGTGFLATVQPREIAVCLSYYSGNNRPNSRGRLYLPMWMIGGATDLRPSSTQMQKVLDWGAIFKDGLPASTFWVVYSRKLNQRYTVTNYWCDNEWDTVRSRGLRATSRVTAP